MNNVRTIIASLTAYLAGVTDRDGIHAAIVEDVVKATGRTPDWIGVTVTVDDNVTATLRTPSGTPQTMPVSEAPGEIIDWHNARTAA